MESSRFEQGRQARAEILGPKYVAMTDESVITNPVIRQWRHYLTEEGWGGVWTRPGLSRDKKSLITITVLATAGRTKELKMHLEGGLRNGLTQEEIGEALIHLSCYAGYPAAVEAFRVAAEVFAEVEATDTAS